MNFIGHGHLFWEHLYQFKWDNYSATQILSEFGITCDYLR